MVEDHYLNLGFRKIEGSETDRFELDVDAYLERECHITIK